MSYETTRAVLPSFRYIKVALGCTFKMYRDGDALKAKILLLGYLLLLWNNKSLKFHTSKCTTTAKR